MRIAKNQHKHKNLEMSSTKEKNQPEFSIISFGKAKSCHHLRKLFNIFYRVKHTP